LAWLLIGLAVAGCSAGSTTATGSPTASPVVSGLVGDVGASTCRPENLRLHASFYGEGAGTATTRLLFRNVGTAECTMRGTPEIGFLTRGGSRVGALIAGQTIGSKRSPRMVTLAPGGRAVSLVYVVNPAMFDVPSQCAAAHTTRMTVRLRPWRTALSVPWWGNTCTARGEPYASPLRLVRSRAQLRAIRDRPCSTGALTARASFSAAGAGNDVYFIAITNDGRTCALLGRPTALIGVTATGRDVRLHPTALSADYIKAMTTGRPAHLIEGATADVVLVTTIACPAGQRPRSAGNTFSSLRLGIGEGRLQVGVEPGPEPSDVGAWLPCGVAMSNFYAAP
jgi:hypothetical protein